MPNKNVHGNRCQTNKGGKKIVVVSIQTSKREFYYRFPHSFLTKSRRCCPGFLIIAARSSGSARLPAERQWKVNGSGGIIGSGVILSQECRGLLTPLFSSSQGDYAVEGKAVLPGRIIALICLWRITVGLKVLFQK